MMKNNILIKELCVDSTEQAVNAEKNGADRIELCKSLDLEGLTPEINVIQKTKDLQTHLFCINYMISTILPQRM